MKVYTIRPGCSTAERVISTSKRETKASGTIPESQKTRAIIVDANALAIPTDACRSAYQAILQQAVHEAADKRFESMMAEDWSRTEVASDAFTLPAILAYWAETQQRHAVTGDAILSWIKAQSWLPAEVREGWNKRVPILAAPLYRRLVTPAQAASISQRILASDCDLDNDAIASFLVQRCANVLASSEEKEIAL